MSADRKGQTKSAKKSDQEETKYVAKENYANCRNAESEEAKQEICLMK